MTMVAICERSPHSATNVSMNELSTTGDRTPRKSWRTRERGRFDWQSATPPSRSPADALGFTRDALGFMRDALGFMRDGLGFKVDHNNEV